MKPTHSFGILFSCLLAFAAPSHAASYYTAGHGDLGVSYNPETNTFDPHWHLDAGSVVDGSSLPSGGEYAPGDIIAHLEGTAIVSNTNVATALHVSAGHTAYRTGISAYPPNLGFALEEVGNPTDWLGETITMALTGFSGPGEMALSQTISGFGTVVWFSSHDSDTTVNDNSWEFSVGGHQHLDWWFSEAGYYEITFRWDGTYLGDGGPINVTGTGTFGLNAGPIIPEPGIFALLAPGVLSLTARRRRNNA